MHNIFQEFWRQHPALLYGLAAFLGVGLGLEGNPWLAVPIGLLIIPLVIGHMHGYRALLSIGVVLGMAFYASNYFIIPPKEVSGTAIFDISSLSLKQSYFGKKWVYKGTVKVFKNDGVVMAKNVPCTINLPEEQLRPPAHCSYRLQGTLKQTQSGQYVLSVQKHSPWHPIENTFSLAEIRFQAKQFLINHIKQAYTSPKAAAFLSGIATGEFDDRIMAYEFSRFGLQHIMAISGFHFAIIAGILSFLLKIPFSRRSATYLLMLLLTVYFIFLGNSPSILRAWIAATIALGGFLFSRRGSGLNSLGIGLICLLFIDPLVYRNIGFQFSFAATAAILLFYNSCDSALQFYFDKRLLSEVQGMNGWNQHGYCLLVFLRRAIALTIAVCLITVPILLYHFQQFPVLSMLYNLFFPFLVTFSMFLLLLGLLLFPPLSWLIHSLNNGYTHFLLNMTYQFPTWLDITWQVQAFPAEYLIIYLSLAFFLSIFIRQYKQNQPLFN